MRFVRLWRRWLLAGRLRTGGRIGSREAVVELVAEQLFLFAFLLVPGAAAWPVGIATALGLNLVHNRLLPRETGSGERTNYRRKGSMNLAKSLRSLAVQV